MARPKVPERRRVQVTLTMEQWALLEEVSEITGQGKATLLGELFEVALPALHSTIEALRVAKAQPREAQRLVTNYGAEQVMKLQQAHLDLDARISEHESKKRKGRRGRTT